jgi:hypothetical protein
MYKRGEGKEREGGVGNADGGLIVSSPAGGYESLMGEIAVVKRAVTSAAPER